MALSFDRRTAALPIALVLAGCSPSLAPASKAVPNAGTTVTPSGLAGSRWIVERVDGARALSRTRVTLDFTTGGVNGFDGCNWFGGTYKTTDRFALAEITSTAVGCPEPVMAQSRAVDRAFEDTARTLRAGNNLVFLDSAGQERLTLRPRPDHGQQADRVANTQWRLVEVDGTPVTDTVTLQLGRSTFQIAIGCGRQTGTYQVQGDRLSFPMRGWEDAECPKGRAPSQAQMRLIDPLDSPTAIWVDGDRLHIEGTNYRHAVFQRCDGCTPPRTQLRVPSWMPDAASGQVQRVGVLAVSDGCLGLRTPEATWSPVAWPDRSAYWMPTLDRLFAGKGRFALGDTVRLEGRVIEDANSAPMVLELMMQDCPERDVFLARAVH